MSVALIEGSMAGKKAKKVVDPVPVEPPAQDFVTVRVRRDLADKVRTLAIQQRVGLADLMSTFLEGPVEAAWREWLKGQK